MGKLTLEQLDRSAYVYIRQSTMGQVRNNKESKRRQYEFKKYAVELGFADVEVIDEDLGKTSDGSQNRSGFEKLLSAVCQNKVGAVFAIEASRLARNGREWHSLLELCAFVGTAIIDADGIYNPAETNDRLLLGLKGSFSEMELGILRKRALDALDDMAKRGELILQLPAGYIKAPESRIQKDPNERVCEAISLVFSFFNSFGSARKVLECFIDNKINLPKRESGPIGSELTWRIPSLSTIVTILHNPIYAGAYVYGRHRRKVVLENGKKRKVLEYLKDAKDWKVLIKDHHSAYISWEDYERNQEILAHNSSKKGEMVKSAVKKGRGLLVGLFRCRKCGRRLCISYGGKDGAYIKYFCPGEGFTGKHNTCLNFGGVAVENAVVKVVLESLSSLGVQASLDAIAELASKENKVRKQIEYELEQARYEADRAWQQYNAVEPNNRLVARQLEANWNKSLEVIAKIEARLANEEIPNGISKAEEAELLHLGEDLAYVWSHPNSPVELKKRLIRTILNEIVVTREENRIIMLLHWMGGEHTQLEVRLNSYTRGDETGLETIQLIRELARIMPDKEISVALNRMGRKTIRGKTFIRQTVRSYRSKYQINCYKEGEIAERGECMIDEVVKTLDISRKTVYRLIKQEILPAKQVCKGAPWIIKKEDLDSSELKRALEGIKCGMKTPLPEASQLIIPFETRR